MNTLEAITARTSIRSYTGQPITDEQLETVLLAAQAAPIGMGRYEDMHLTVITQPELLGEIDAAGAAMFGKPDMHPLYGAPTLVLVSTVVPDDAGGANVAYSNAAVVVQNMALAAVELGVGAVHIWGAIRALVADEELVAQLGLPAGMTPCCAIALGCSEQAYEPRDIPADRIARDLIA